MNLKLPVSITLLAVLAAAPAAQASPGDLKPVQALRASAEVPMNQANGIAASPDGKHVYVAAQLDDSVGVFERKPSTGQLRFLEDRRVPHPIQRLAH